MIHFDLASLIEEVQTNETLINSDQFWNDRRKAVEIVNKNNILKTNLDTYNKIKNQIDELNQIYLMLKEDYDEEIHENLSSSLVVLLKEMEDFEVQVLLSNEFDNYDAIL